MVAEAPMDYQELLLSIDDPVATITLNRPDKLNALTLRAMLELRHALIEAERSTAVVGIVLTGAGRGFCAGLDLGALAAMEKAGTTKIEEVVPELAELDVATDDLGEDFARGMTYLLALRKPLLAAINGPAAGLGFSIAMMCDLRFMASDAVLNPAFAQRGLVAEHGNSWLLPRLMGSARALDVLWSGRKIDGSEAHELGMVNRVLPADRLLGEAQDYIRQLAATASPTSLMHIKRQVYADLMRPLGPAMEASEALTEASMKWPDLKEGIAAFVEKRLPRFARIGADSGQGN
jgi:enoyl-CoA hydratase/carnithine racemase